MTQPAAGLHQKGSFSLGDLMENVRNNPSFSDAGAVALVVGVVRGASERGEKVEELKLEAYEEKAEEVLLGICNDLRRRKGIVDVQIHHLLGEFSVGEEMVYVLVAGSHRKEVFSVLELAVDRYKREAPIFKQEQVLDKNGRRRAYWVEESRKRAL